MATFKYTKLPIHFQSLPPGTYPSGQQLDSDVRAADIHAALGGVNVREGTPASGWEVDFVFKDELTAADEVQLNHVIQEHDGQLYVADEKAKETHDRLLATRNLPYDPDREPFRVGYRFDIVSNSLNIWDIPIELTMTSANSTVQLMGGRFWVPDNTHGDDYVDVVVVDKLGVIPDVVDGNDMSLMEHYGLPTDGSTFLEVSDKIADKSNCPIGNPAGRGMNPGGNFEVFAGLFVRIKFQANGTEAYNGTFKIDLNFAK